MKNENEKLNKVLEMITAGIVTQSEIEQFLVVVLDVIKKSKDNFETISAENLSKIEQVVSYISQEHKKVLSEIDTKQSSFKKDVSSSIEATKREIDLRLKETKALLEEAILMSEKEDEEPEEEIDEEKIVESVLAKIKFPESEKMTADSLLEMLNSSDIQIDASRIKNLPAPEVTKIEAGGRLLSQLNDVDTSGIVNNSTLKWNLTRSIWEMGSATGGSGIQSIVAGTNINVDNTDPLNPIVSSTGGGGITGSGANTQIAVWTGATTQAGYNALSYNSATGRFQITDGVFPGPGRAFLVDAATYTVDMGDISSKSNRVGMTINNPSETITMYGQDSTAARVRIFEAFTNTDLLGAGLSFGIGDIDNSANGTKMQLIDASGIFRVGGSTYHALNLDFASESYGFADYTQTTSGGSNVGGIEIAAGGVFNMYGLGADSTIAPFMSILAPGDLYFGDLNGLGSATTFSILESSGGLYDFSSRVFQIGGHTYKFPSTQAISGQALVAQDTNGTLLYENVQRNLFAQTQSVTVANTTTPTTITGTGEGSLLVRSGTAKVGSTYELDFEGFYNATSSPTISYKLKILGTNIGSSITNTIPSGGSSWDVRGHFKLTVLTTGASGTASLNGYITYDKNNGTSVTYPINQTAFQAINTTINQTTDFVATWSAADPLNSLTIRQLTFNQTR